MIPHANVKDLMLRDEVIEAVKKGEFHIWAVKTIDEGIEILTGMKAGVRKKDGTYPANTINALVDARLKKLADQLVAFGKGGDDDGKGGRKSTRKKNPSKKK